MTPALYSAGAAALVALAAWVVRMALLDRIERLEKSIENFGVRLGALKSWQEAHDAVELDRAGRDWSGRVRGDGGE